mgnify:CR=1 FL=1
MSAIEAIGDALRITFSMTWEILWALILGFTLSAIVQALVRRATILRHLADDHPKPLAAATGLGMAGSSCSYPAVAPPRPRFRSHAVPVGRAGWGEPRVVGLCA